LVRIPWQNIESAGVAWGLTGLCGLIYTAVIIRRMLTQSVYQPVFEDWLFHALLPGLAYAVLAVSALCTLSETRDALFGVGTGALLLLFISIHNAWDGIAYHVTSRLDEQKSKQD
ncbi:MAG TPA: hypothetical protein VGM47_10920, partial [Gammaproteobacteria bacterium]